MTTTWKSFLIRSTSALIALALVVGLYLYMDVKGVKIAVTFAIIIGTWELMTVLFNEEPSWFLKFSFLVFSLLTFGSCCLVLNIGILVFALSIILLCVFSLLSLHKSASLERIFQFQARAAMGLFYMGLLPAFAYRLLDVMQGLSWFVFLLLVVFAGDVFAYVFGMLLGKHKVMPAVSPKKTWQGSVGGISGSILAGLVCWIYLLSNFDVWFILGLSAVSGFIAQFGDFFESLLKRVANVKDSGKIMPGHGGVLDRIDGVLFASPVVLFGVVFLSHFLS